MSNRTSKKFTSKPYDWEDLEVEFTVGLNHENYATGRASGLYLGLKDQFGHEAYSGVSVDNIPDIIAALQGVYDEFEVHKPKGPKDVAEALAVFPSGTVIKFDRDYHTRYVKVGGRWTSTAYDSVADFTDWDIEDWPFTVKYQPNDEEEN